MPPTGFVLRLARAGVTLIFFGGSKRMKRVRGSPPLRSWSAPEPQRQFPVKSEALAERHRV